jgi:hypothetical protein
VDLELLRHLPLAENAKNALLGGLPDAVINWKMADGTFVTLDTQAITAVAMAVRAHVQAYFDREAVLKAQIEAATTAEGIAAINLNIGWP